MSPSPSRQAEQKSAAAARKRIRTQMERQLNQSEVDPKIELTDPVLLDAVIGLDEEGFQAYMDRLKLLLRVRAD